MRAPWLALCICGLPLLLSTACAEDIAKPSSGGGSGVVKAQAVDGGATTDGAVAPLRVR